MKLFYGEGTNKFALDFTYLESEKPDRTKEINYFYSALNILQAKKIKTEFTSMESQVEVYMIDYDVVVNIDTDPYYITLYSTDKKTVLEIKRLIEERL